MTWSIQQVAQMSGITSRTLRHYDEIGLLRPDSVGANGYRYYERAQLLRGRLDRLAETVETTIKHLENGTDMPAESLFAGFEFGPEYIDRGLHRTKQPELEEVKNRTADWSEEDFASFNDQGAYKGKCGPPTKPATSRWPNHWRAVRLA